MENYRPIVVLSHLRKIAEELITTRIYNFMESKNLFTDRQYEYRMNYSTELVCVDFVQKIYEYLDKGKKIALLFFHLTAAFDMHQR